MFLNITEKEYRGLPLPSYSTLAKIDELGPGGMVWTCLKMSDNMVRGSLVDTMLFEPHEISNRFFVIEWANKVTPQLEALQEELIKRFQSEVGKMNDHEIVLSLMNEMDLYKTTKAVEKRLAIFNTTAFWSSLGVRLASKTKVGVQRKLYNECEDIVNILKHDEISKGLFTTRKGVEEFNQPKIVFELDGKEVKGMYDKVIIDHNNKTIQPFDLKVTSFHQKEFPKLYFKHHYYIQAGLYSKGIQYIIKTKLGYADYTLLPFTFLVFSVPDNMPMMWETPLENIDKAINGYDSRYGHHIKGVKELIREYDYYKANPASTRPFEFINKSVMKLNVL